MFEYSRVVNFWLPQMRSRSPSKLFRFSPTGGFPHQRGAYNKSVKSPPPHSSLVVYGNLLPLHLDYRCRFRLYVHVHCQGLCFGFLSCHSRFSSRRALNNCATLLRTFIISCPSQFYATISVFFPCSSFCRTYDPPS